MRVFTPKGLAVSLTAGSTPIDFAYHIHTRIGETAVGARVNGSIVPLSHRLQNGDMVEVLTSKGGKPSEDWLNFVATRSARTKIRAYSRQQKRDEGLQKGHDLLEKYLRRRQLAVRQLMRSKLLEEAAQKLLGTRNPDELYLALAAGKLTPSVVARILSPTLAQEQAAPRAPRPAAVRPSEHGIYVEGFTTQTKISNCCSPIRGDQIMGYLTRGRGVSIHRIDCPNMVRLLAGEPERCVAASWNAASAQELTVDLDVVAGDRPHLLADVMKVLSDQSASSLKVEAGVDTGGTAHIHLRLSVDSPEKLEAVRSALLAVENVTDVLRIGRGPRRGAGAGA